jgi:acyl-CoA synthetase (AMP-forming)/AMP-acid ligase II
VFGVPDTVLGENVAAVVALRKGSSLTRDNAGSIMNAYLEDKLAHYKRPRYYTIVNSIPRNHMGKVNKKTIIKDLNLSY